ncbi:MAG: hypothetical protein WC489_03465 [Patescibacteria group bacterium]
MAFVTINAMFFESRIDTIQERGERKGPFVVEFAGSPSFVTDKFVKVWGDYLEEFHVNYKGYQGTSFPDLNTAEDVFMHVRESIDRLRVIDTSPHPSFLLGGSIFEEMAYLQYCLKKNLITEHEAEVYQNLLRLYAPRVDFVMLTLLSPKTSLSEHYSSKLTLEGHDEGNEPITYVMQATGEKAYAFALSNLHLFNDCCRDTLSIEAHLFQRIHLVDFTDSTGSLGDIALDLFQEQRKGLSRVYPISPNPIRLR